MKDKQSKNNLNGSDDAEIFFAFLGTMGLGCIGIGIVNAVAPQIVPEPLPLYVCIILIFVGIILDLISIPAVWICTEEQDFNQFNKPKKNDDPYTPDIFKDYYKE
jgi:hypothetical protein